MVDDLTHPAAERAAREQRRWFVRPSDLLSIASRGARYP